MFLRVRFGLFVCDVFMMSKELALLELNLPYKIAFLIFLCSLIKIGIEIKKFHFNKIFRNIAV